MHATLLDYAECTDRQLDLLAQAVRVLTGSEDLITAAAFRRGLFLLEVQGVRDEEPRGSNTQIKNLFTRFGPKNNNRACVQMHH